jgi:hypothetical protein
MKSPCCLRIALVLGGLAAWQSLGGTAEAGLFGLFGCHRHCQEPVCCEVYTCDPCTTCDTNYCGECVSYCGEYGRRGRRARRCGCRMPRRMRRGCGMCATSCGCPTYCGCCETSCDSGCGSYCPCHVGCGRRAGRMGRRCGRRANRMCCSAVSYTCCESYSCCDSCSPCHVGCGRRMRGCGRRMHRRGGCCGVESCGCPSHCDSGMGCGHRRLRGRRNCHYCANDMHGYGCSTGGCSTGGCGQECQSCGPTHAPAVETTPSAEPHPVDVKDPPLPMPSTKPENLPTPPSEGPTAYRMRSRI